MKTYADKKNDLKVALFQFLMDRSWDGWMRLQAATAAAYQQGSGLSGPDIDEASWDAFDLWQKYKKEGT